MAKARFAYDNLAHASTSALSASSAVADRPVAYLTNAARWKRWRSAVSTGDQSVSVAFGGAQLVRVVALVDWTAHPGGSVRAETWNGAAWDLFGTFTLATPNPTGVIAVWNPTGVSTTQIRVVFTNTGAVTSDVDLGVLLVGTYFEPSYTLSDGFSVQPVDPSLIVAAIDGQEETQERARYHLAQATFDTLGSADLAAFRAMFAAVGHRRPLLCALDPTNPDEMLYARLTESPYEHQYQNTWSFPVSMREVR